MADAIISRRSGRPFKTGTIINENSKSYTRVKSITISDLIGAKNAIIADYSNLDTVYYNNENIINIHIEDGIITSVLYHHTSSSPSFLDLKYINFDATTGTISLVNAGDVGFTDKRIYKYIIY